MSARQMQQDPAPGSTAAGSGACGGAAACQMMWCNVALTVAMPACRGGLILYRTQLPAGAVRNGGLLDVTAPVHDYAKVGQSSVTSWPRRGGSQGRCMGQKLSQLGRTFHGRFSHMDASLCRGSCSGHCNAALLCGGLIRALVASWLPVFPDQTNPTMSGCSTAYSSCPMAAGIGGSGGGCTFLKCSYYSTDEASMSTPMAAGPA